MGLILPLFFTQMIIAVNTRLQKSQQPDGFEDFIFDLLEKLTEKYPRHQFIYIFDKPYTGNRVFAKNVLPVVTIPQTTGNLRLQYWFNFKVPKLLRQHRADVFLSFEGICSIRTKKPQCLLVSHTAWQQSFQMQKKWVHSFYRKFMPVFLTKAKSIVAVSDFIKKELEEKYSVASKKIELLYPGIDENFKPLDWEQAEAIRDKYTDGKSYFLFSGNINKHSNYINLLKAFTFFKKRQKSNMLLLFAGNPDEQFLQDLKTYKLKNEVKLLQGLSVKETAHVTAAAYAMVNPTRLTGLINPILQAMQCHVPVIVADTDAMQSAYEQAVVYCNPAQVEDIANKMMLIYKDEEKAKALVEAANRLIKKHNWDNTVQTLMQCLQNAANS